MPSSTPAQLHKSLYPMPEEFVMPTQTTPQVGTTMESMGTDTSSSAEGTTPAQQKQMAKTAASGMSAGGSIGQVLTGAGVSGIVAGAPVMGMAGGAAAAGLALSLYEAKKQADAADERARIEEAENRKLAVQGAINQQISAARMLGV